MREISELSHVENPRYHINESNTLSFFARSIVAGPSSSSWKPASGWDIDSLEYNPRAPELNII